MRRSVLVTMIVIVVVVLGVVYGTGLLRSEEDELASMESGLPDKEALSGDIDAAGQVVIQELLLDADLIDPLDEEDESFIEEDPSVYENDSFSDF